MEGQQLYDYPRCLQPSTRSGRIFFSAKRRAAESERAVRAAVEEVMLSAGITPPTEKEEQAKGFDIYAPVAPRTPPR